MSMGLGQDIAYQMSLVKRESGESDEHLAERLYYVQMEVLSANAGCNLVSNDQVDLFQFKNLNPEIRNNWIEKAKAYK